MKMNFAHAIAAIMIAAASPSTPLFAKEAHLQLSAAPEIELLDFIDVQHLSEEALFEFMEGRLPSIAIEFPEKLQLPLEVFIDGDVVSLLGSGDTPGRIQFNRTIYLRNIQGSLYLSTDLKNWKPFESFVRGRLQVGLKIDEEKGPQLTLGAELYERQREN